MEQDVLTNYRFYSDGTRTFLEVVDRTGFGKAARTLGVNQSAVSQQISRLEDALGRKLFRRAASGVTLTADGETFLFYARSMAALTEDVRRHFAQDAGTGLLVVGMNELFSRTALPSILWLLAKTHPGLKLRVICGGAETMIARFDAGDLDVLVTTGFHGSVRPEVFWSERLVWIGRAGEGGTVPDPVPLVIPEHPSPLRDIVFATLRKHNRNWIVAFETSNVSVGEAAVSAGFGYCAVPQKMALQGPVQLDPSCGLPQVPDAEFVVLSHPRSRSGATAAFCKILAEAAQSNIGAESTFPTSPQA